MTKTAKSSPSGGRPPLAVQAAAGYGLVELRNDKRMLAQVLPSGAVHALRCGDTLLNRALTGPAEEGSFRLLLRWRSRGRGEGWSSLAGPGRAWSSEEASATWSSEPAAGLKAAATLRILSGATGWVWEVDLSNVSSGALDVSAVIAQDLGLGDEGAVRNNESYNSQYLDLHAVSDPSLGWCLFARQNQPDGKGEHPWLGVACDGHASAYATDGTQFFGEDHRLTGVPLAASHDLPSRVLQREFALASLQSRWTSLGVGGHHRIRFFFLHAHHREPSSAADVQTLRSVIAADRPQMADFASLRNDRASVFTKAPWLHGETAESGCTTSWFPGAWRHEERGPDGSLHSFFCGEATHVVLREKEARVARPHGHILRSGQPLWPDADHWGVTCYAAGLFGSQAYLGNASVGRLLSVSRDALGLGRSSGQRIFLRASDGWHQLGIPSAFAMSPSLVRWIYRKGTGRVEVRAWCSRDQPVSFLSIVLIDLPPAEILVTHELALGANEFTTSGSTSFAPDGWALVTPSRESFLAKHRPGVGFAIAAAEPEGLAQMSGDAALYDDGREREGPYVCLLSRSVTQFGVLMTGSAAPGGFPAGGVEAARREYLDRLAPAPAEPPPVKLSGADPSVSAVNEILPWFAHNAGIHFSAPHGLEQYGGGAWGVRDVCQGSLEWLLASRQHGVVREMLLAVFAQQYEADGDWPQWFMQDPFRFIQQGHSHGDVVLWPLKALCDYIEASGDAGLLRERVGYTDPSVGRTVGPEETLLEHCERALARCRERCLEGTALINYGEGDWDDTLQPADPSMKTRMVSAWTVALMYHTLRQLARVCRFAGEGGLADALEAALTAIRHDFVARLMPDGVVAGFMVTEPGKPDRPLLHPADWVTGIRYRLLPMTRSMLAELFNREEALAHLALIRANLLFPDGARLMSEPPEYHRGLERLFKRADTAANFGREIGLQYVHAHLRYAEALAKLGEADAAWLALQQVNPVALSQVVPQALPRQANAYFSSSDADFATRPEARAKWAELRAGKVRVFGGWRVYSSGPGLFLDILQAHLLGLRESFGDWVFDPVLPKKLDGLEAEILLEGRPVTIEYRISDKAFGPSEVLLNGETLPATREPNPYRLGGLRVRGKMILGALKPGANRFVVRL